MLLEDVEGPSSWICVAMLKWTEAVVAAVSLPPLRDPCFMQVLTPHSLSCLPSSLTESDSH